jgi:hypothetical protein
LTDGKRCKPEQIDRRDGYQGATLAVDEPVEEHDRHQYQAVPGPQHDVSLKAHGRIMMARKDAIWLAATPWLASYAGTAIFIRPKGMPCAKYMDEPAA